ncbi:unnamed protein product [Arctogadus glacialis]
MVFFNTSATFTVTPRWSPLGDRGNHGLLPTLMPPPCDRGVGGGGGSTDQIPVLRNDVIHRQQTRRRPGYEAVIVSAGGSSAAPGRPGGARWSQMFWKAWHDRGWSPGPERAPNHTQTTAA